MARRRTETLDAVELTHVGGGWWMTHGLALTGPGIGCGAFALFVYGAHAFGGGDPIKTPLLSIVALVIGAAITWFMVDSAGQRKHFRLVMTITGVFGTLNLVLGLIVGPQAWMVWTYVVSSLIVWAVWVIWRGSKYGGGITTAQSDGTGMNALLEMAKDARTKVHPPKMDDRGVIRSNMSTLPGGTIEDAQALVSALSAEARAVRGGVSLVKHPDLDGLGVIEIATRDNLKNPIPWPGIKRLGTLPTDPFPVGEYQSGVCQVQLVGDYRKNRSARDISHIKVGGVTGSGKSTGAQVLLASMMAMRRLNIVGLDVSTELQILGPLSGGLTWLITDEEEARQFLHRMNKVVIPGRKAHLAREGLKRWTLDSSLNMGLAWVEESKAFHRLSTAYHTMVADARAAGWMIGSSTQSWLYRNASTDVRKQHTSGWCFGMSEPDDVGTVLPEEAVAALGDNLPTWGDRKPGYSLLAGLGIPEHLWSKMLRAYDPLREQLLEAVRIGAPYRDPMDPVTEELFGELFANRTTYGQVPAAVGRPVVRITPPRNGDDNHIQDDDDEEASEDVDAMVAEEYEQDRQEVLAELNEQRRRDLGDTANGSDLEGVDPDQPIPLLGHEEDDDEGHEVQLSPQQAQRIWDEKVDALYRSGVRHLQTSTLAEWLAEVGRARPFLYRQVDRWQEAGRLEPRPDADGWDLIGSPLEARQSPPHGE